MELEVLTQEELRVDLEIELLSVWSGWIWEAAGELSRPFDLTSNGSEKRMGVVVAWVVGFGGWRLAADPRRGREVAAGR